MNNRLAFIAFVFFVLIAYSAFGQQSNDKAVDNAVSSPSAEAPKAGDRKILKINDVEFAFRWCPPGTFTMGSPESEEGRRDDETQHTVTFTKGFWIMETEVTQKQWNAVMGKSPSRFLNEDLPVECVSWIDSQKFCKKCAELGFSIQLPTESQWEYACRAGSTGTYAGDLDAMAWYLANSDRKPHPVGTKKPNAWGIYDMHGNVREWCADWYGDYPSGSVTDPPVPANGSRRILRGGGFGGRPGDCRAADRWGYDPGIRYYCLGFRCVTGQDN